MVYWSHCTEVALQRPRRVKNRGGKEIFLYIASSTIAGLRKLGAGLHLAAQPSPNNSFRSTRGTEVPLAYGSSGLTLPRGDRAPACIREYRSPPVREELVFMPLSLCVCPIVAVFLGCQPSLPH